MKQVWLDADEHPAITWRYAEAQAIGYRITDMGLRAIGADIREPSTGVDQTELAGLTEAEFATEADLEQLALDVGIGAATPDTLDRGQAGAEADMPQGGAEEPAEAGQPFAGSLKWPERRSSR